jgi:lipoprotein-anchoring transpeptidase ErfK/SrfK
MAPVRLQLLLGACALAACLLGPAAATAARAGGGIAQPESTVATAAHRSVAVYRTPVSHKPFVVLPNPTADGVPLTFLVKTVRPHWLEVYVPVRPNGTTGWVRPGAVRLTTDPFSVEVRLGAHRIVVREGDRVIDSEPVGVGRSVVPTPVGRYFIVELLKQPDPNGPYGPYAFGLSAFSDVYQSFGGGPGSIGLHGTNEPWLLGHDVSHGCVRMSNAGIRKLAGLLPLGTPVAIVR